MSYLKNVVLDQTELVIVSIEAFKLNDWNGKEAILNGSNNPEWIT